jgi:hypothetical protein
MRSVLLDPTIKASLRPHTGPGRHQRSPQAAVGLGAAPRWNGGQDRLYRVGLSQGDHVGNVVAPVPLAEPLHNTQSG